MTHWQKNTEHKPHGKDEGRMGKKEVSTTQDCNTTDLNNFIPLIVWKK